MKELFFDGFIFQLPLWTLALNVRSKGEGKQVTDGFAGYNIEGGKCIALFTDEDLAERAAKQAGNGLSPFTIPDRKKFSIFLGNLAKDNFKHAAFDPDITSGKSRSIASIDEMKKVFSD
jgi:hypothetical protein